MYCTQYTRPIDNDGMQHNPEEQGKERIEIRSYNAKTPVTMDAGCEGDRTMPCKKETHT